MARSRNIKPGFFTNEDLVELDFATRLLFAGLWTIADKEGRLQDRPKKIKIDLFPADNLDIDVMLQSLHDANFILRYEVNGAKYVQIVAWKKHQNPHHTEKASEIPEPHGCLTVKETLEPKDAPIKDGGNLADSLLLIPDSGFTDSLIPDSLNQDQIPFGPPAAQDVPAPKIRAKREPKAPAPSAETWTAYANAYRLRYGVDPVRNAAVNGQLAQLVARLGADESPLVAAWYVGHKNQFYVSAGHSVGMLLRDAEKLRTQWATNRAMTQTEAQQADKTAANFNAFAPLLAEARAKEQGETYAEH